MKTAVLVLFLVMYALMIALPKRRVIIAMIAAFACIAAGALPFGALPTVIDWNVLMMIAGTMIIVDYFITSGMPGRIADWLLAHSGSVRTVTIYMSLFAGLISAFIDNVATVLMVAPVGLALCAQLGISPVPMILSIAVSSNLQGAATLVGDTTSIMLGAYANMDFMDFFFMQGRLGIFFAVELGALATIPIMLFLFRKDTAHVHAEGKTEVHDLLPTFMLLAVVLCLIAASFIPNKPDVINGVICLVLAALTMLLEALREHSLQGAHRALSALDVETLLLLASLFCVIAAVTNEGLIDDVAALIAKAGGNNLFLLYSLIVWGSVLISAFVDNIPYVATMLPVVSGVAAHLGISPNLLYFGLLTGATLGGNLTPIGASANITAVGLLKKQGCNVSFRDFMRIGVPFTLAAVLAGYLFIWFVWA